MYNETGRGLRCQLARSLRNHHLRWWVGKYEEVEKAKAIEDSRNLYQLIRNTGSGKPNVNQMIQKIDGRSILNSVDCSAA